MQLHDDPQALVETLAEQHALVLGELHGDLAARLAEVPDRFVDQGEDPRRIVVSCTVLETVLFSRWRRQTPDSTLKAKAGNGFGILLTDGKGTLIGVRKHPRKHNGELITPVTYVPGGEQYSIEDELGHPIGGEVGVVAPQGYRLYVLWWPGSLALGGAVLAAGVLNDTTAVLYASTPLPPPIMEDRSVTVGLPRIGEKGVKSLGSGMLGKRRRDDDFAGIDGVEEGREESAPPETS